MRDTKEILSELQFLKEVYEANLKDARKNAQEAIRAQSLYEAQEYLADAKTAIDKLSVVEALLDFINQ